MYTSVKKNVECIHAAKQEIMAYNSNNMQKPHNYIIKDVERGMLLLLCRHSVLS